jgi:segregation and condensation protein A
MHLEKENVNSDSVQRQPEKFDIMEIAEKPEWKQMLVDIVQREKMNPWDVDLSVVATRFVGTIKKMKKLNLRISANVVLAASIVLRYKSDALILQDDGRGNAQAVFIPDHVYEEPIFPRLEATSRVTKRKVTLDELISAVEDVMSKEKRKAQRRRQRLDNIIPEPLLEMVTTEENFEKKLEEIYHKVEHCADKEKLVLFSNLVDHKTVENVVGTLVPLLHLANKQRIAMWQEEFFGEIFIHLTNGNGVNLNVEKVKETGKIKATRTARATRGTATRRTRTAARKAK